MLGIVPSTFQGTLATIRDTTNAVVLCPALVPYLCVKQFQGNTAGSKEKKTLPLGHIAEVDFTSVAAILIPTQTVGEY